MDRFFINLIFFLKNERKKIPHIKKMNFEYFIQRPSIKRNKYPLLIYLHGYGENYTSILKKSSLPGIVSENDLLQQAIVVTPFAPDGRWWKCEDLFNFTKKIIQQENVDITRIYICGISMGGYAAWAMISQYPNCFAAIIPICGGANPFNRLFTLPIRWNEFNYEKFLENKHTAVWAFHGALDIIVPYYESTKKIDRLRNIGNKNCKLTIYKWAGHSIFRKTFNNAEIYKWLFSQQLQNIVVQHSLFYEPTYKFAFQKMR
tara:strand:- start:180 stop:959 length:780 start_codon:yes stop_codon:yes gene_type:complete